MVAGSALFPGIVSQLLAGQPHSAAKAKRVIFLFMSGGVSHVDTWDPKPKLKGGARKRGPQEGPARGARKRTGPQEDRPLRPRNTRCITGFFRPGFV